MIPTASSRNGYTLVELLVVIGIIALITAIAIPSTISMVHAADVRSDTYRLITRIRYLQAEAVRQQKTITIGQGPGNTLKQFEDAIIFSNGTVVDTVAPVSFYADGTTSGGRLRVHNGTSVTNIDIAWLIGTITTEQAP